MSKSIQKLTGLIKPWMFYLIAAGIMAIAVSMCEQVIPLQVRIIVNTAFDRKSGRQIPWDSIGLFLGILILTQMVRIGQRLMTEWAATRLSAHLFEQGVRHLLSYPVSWFADHHSGAMQVRLERSTRAITDLVKLILSDILSPLVSFFVAVGIIWHTDERVGMTMGLIVPVLIALTLWQARSQAGIRISINRAREEQGVRVVEAVEGIEQVKLFRAEAAEAARAGSVAKALADKEYRHHRAMAGFDLAKLLTERVGFGAVLLLGLEAALRPGSTIGVGGVVMLLMLFDRIAEPVRNMHRIIDEANEKWILVRDYVPLLDIEPDRLLAQTHALEMNADIICEDVEFAYYGSGKTVLNQVSLRIACGSKVAVVGASGSGKSTLGRLICGLHRPTAGHILVAGQEIRPIEEHGMARTVGMLSQKPYLFAGTIAENIRYGQPDATDEELRRAAELAGLADYIETLDDGYSTQLGQHGGGLSGGQGQRLALARLLLLNPDIIIFDEPTASLDPINARRFFDVVLQRFQDKTVIVITHDWSDFEWADQIVVIEDGRVQEVCSYRDRNMKDTAECACQISTF